MANGLLFRTSPAIADPAGVLSIYTVPQSDPVFGQTSFPDFVTLDTQVASLETVAAMRVGAVTLGDGPAGRPVMVEIVSTRFFDVLGVRPALGRLFSDEETRPGLAQPVAIVSHDFWQHTLGGRPDVLGTEVRLDGRRFTIVGVAPKGLRGRLAEMTVAAWVPAGLPGGFYHATDREIRDRSDREYAVLARARPGVSVDQVAAELAVLGRRLHAEYGDQWEDERDEPLAFRVVAGNPGLLPPEFTTALAATAAVALAGAALVLLIACSNVAGLLLAQAHDRRQEIALRSALGAGRGRLVHMLMVESGWLALAGGAAGLLAARAGVAAIGSVALPMGAPLEFDFSLDWRVLVFALGVSAIACVAFGLLPALTGSRADLVPALKAGHDAPPGRRSLGFRRALVVAQVTASVVLLVGAGLALRSARTALGADLGFDPDRVAVVSKALSFDPEVAPETMVRFRDLAARIASHPEVESVALSTAVERVFDDLTIADVRPDSVAPGDDEPRPVRMNAVDPGYLSMLHLDVVAGRALTPEDRLGSERVALVNEAYASRHWPGQPAVGHTLHVASVRTLGMPVRRQEDRLTVVGVVRDPDGPSAPDGDSELSAASLVGVSPRIWVPLSQHPSNTVVIHARARQDAASLVPILREEAGTDDVPLIAAQPLAQLISYPLVVQRTTGRVMRWAGAFALALSFLGIYGIVSFTVTQRSREMAIRKAMGARSDQVVRGVMRHGVVLALWGVGLGLAIVAPLSWLVDRKLATIHPMDPVAFGGGVAVILLASLVASVLPARRLATVDPMAVLRDE
ncbi:MAG: ABC transporter permease [Vicinamibacterales bacterium]